MKLRRLLLAAAIVLLPCAADVYACQCRERKPPCAQYWEADAVFVGSVIEISPAAVPHEGGSPEYETVRFYVERSFRGVEGDKAELAEWPSSCRYGFEAGKKYLVYAYRDRDGNRLGTNYCTRTTELSNAAEDLQYLNGLSVEPPGEAVTGRLVDGEKRLAGVRVVAEGMGRRFSSVSDEKGWFSLTVAEPGEYRVRIYLPRHAGVGGTGDLLDKISGTMKTKRHYVLMYEVEVKAGRCAYIDVPLLI